MSAAILSQYTCYYVIFCLLESPKQSFWTSRETRAALENLFFKSGKMIQFYPFIQHDNKKKKSREMQCFKVLETYWNRNLRKTSGRVNIFWEWRTLRQKAMVSQLDSTQTSWPAHGSRAGARLQQVHRKAPQTCQRLPPAAWGLRTRKFFSKTQAGYLQEAQQQPSLIPGLD